MAQSNGGMAVSKIMLVAQLRKETPHAHVEEMPGARINAFPRPVKTGSEPVG